MGMGGIWGWELCCAELQAPSDASILDSGLAQKVLLTRLGRNYLFSFKRGFPVWFCLYLGTYLHLY